LRTPAAFATMLISQENFGIGLAMHRAPTPKDAVPVATGQSMPVPVSVRHPLTTSSAQAALPLWMLPAAHTRQVRRAP
jgi:hypothetical protein